MERVKVHAIIDLMHIYYKYHFQMKSGKLRKLTTAVNRNGTYTEEDISTVYYTLRDIEGIRKSFKEDVEVTLSICIDTPSKRRSNESEASSQYKAGRKHTLTDDDFYNIKLIGELLEQAGNNVYRIDGYEADDIVNYLVRTYKDNFNLTVVYTNDKDLLVNVCDNVMCMRYKTTKGYRLINKDTYEDYLSNEFEADIPYNAIGLFLSSVGDKADNIKGINKFGPKAFNKLISSLNENEEINWEEVGDYSKLEKVIEKCSKYLTDVQYGELVEAFKLVSNMDIDVEIAEPNKLSTRELREKAYMQYNMVSLV